jgi:hypothetical protein
MMQKGIYRSQLTHLSAAENKEDIVGRGRWCENVAMNMWRIVNAPSSSPSLSLGSSCFLISTHFGVELSRRFLLLLLLLWLSL